jgi:hypothetical protein
VDLVRSCFTTAKNGEPSERETELHTQIERDFSRQVVVMRGLSLGGEGTSRSSSSESEQLSSHTEQQQQQPVLIKFPRHEGGTTEEEYIQTQLYIVERAVACTEFATRGQQEKVLVVMDGGSGSSSSGSSGSSSSSHAPPVSWQLTAIRRVQHMYPERLGQLIIVDAPFWMRGIYHSIRPFLPPSTRHKIQLVSSSSTVRCCCCCCCCMQMTARTATLEWKKGGVVFGGPCLCVVYQLKQWIFCSYLSHCLAYMNALMFRVCVCGA